MSSIVSLLLLLLSSRNNVVFNSKSPTTNRATNNKFILPFLRKDQEYSAVHLVPWYRGGIRFIVSKLEYWASQGGITLSLCPGIVIKYFSLNLYLFSRNMSGSLVSHKRVH